MKWKLVVICTSITLLVSFSCGSHESTYTIEIKDGIKYVHNYAPLWGDEPKVSLEFVRQIGELDTKDENYMFYQHGDIILDTDGNLYVLDAGNYRIQKFDSNGKYLSTFGRKGQGPSEFNIPNGLQIDAEGNLYVCNVIGSRLCWIHVLSPDGKEIRRFKLPPLSDIFWMTHSGKIITIALEKIDENTSKLQKRTSLMYMMDNNGSIIREFGEVITIKQDRKEYSPNDFSLDVDSHDNICLAFKNQNRIEKYDSEGKLIWRADRQIKYELSYGTKEIPWEAMGIPQKPMIVSDISKVSAGIGIDHKNRIWIKTYKKQKEEGDSLNDYIEFEIYDNDGILLGKLAVQQQGNLSVFEDRLYLVDSKEEMCIYEYKIVDK